MKKPLKLLLIATVVTGAVATGMVYAMPGGGERCLRGGHDMGMSMGPGRHGMDAEMRIDRMADALDLTKEQRAQVRGIADKSRPQSRELRDRLHDNRKLLRALMQQDKASEGEVRRLADIQGKAIADMIVLRAKVQSDIRAILTPEQRQKIQSRFEQRHGHPAMQEGQGPDRQSDAGNLDEPHPAGEKGLVKRVSM